MYEEAKYFGYSFAFLYVIHKYLTTRKQDNLLYNSRRDRIQKRSLHQSYICPDLKQNIKFKCNYFLFQLLRLSSITRRKHITKRSPKLLPLMNITYLIPQIRRTGSTYVLPFRLYDLGLMHYLELRLNYTIAVVDQRSYQQVSYPLSLCCDVLLK